MDDDYSTDEESPRGGGGKMRESHKSLPHHDSLRELEVREARAERKGKKDHSRGDSNNTNNNNNINNNNNYTTGGMISNNGPEPHQSTPPTPSESSNSSLLKEGSDPSLKKRGGNIVSVADIEISPQERLHVQDTLDPEIHRVKKKKKKKKLQDVLRRKPVVEDKTPRRIHFNDPERNASYKYLYF